ncbi:MAG: hypothetical protein ACTHJW_27035 [Streptosporangiaceae bacterium]
MLDRRRVARGRRVFFSLKSMQYSVASNSVSQVVELIAQEFRLRDR